MDCLINNATECEAITVIFSIIERFTHNKAGSGEDIDGHKLIYLLMVNPNLTNISLIEAICGQGLTWCLIPSKNSLIKSVATSCFHQECEPTF